MNRKQTRRIVEGAFMLAILGVFIVIDSYTAGMFNLFLYFLIPLPFIWYGYTYQSKDLLILTFCSIVLGLFLGLPETIFYLICGSLISIIATYGIEKKVSSGIMFLMIISMTIVSEILLYTLFAKLFGYDLITEFESMYRFVTENIRFIEITQSYEMMLKTVLPLFVVVLGMIEGYIFMSLLSIVLNRLKIPFVKKFHIVHMQLPKWYGIIACISFVVASLIMNVSMVDTFYYLCSYVRILTILSLMLQGVSFLGVYLIVKGKNIYFIFILLLLLMPKVNYLLVPFGLLDIFSEKRKNLLYNKQ